MEPLTWKPEYDMGFPELDSQHRELMNLVNLTLGALEALDEKRVEGLLDRLMTYAKMHFALEEGPMEEAGIPGLEAHRQGHARFQQKVTHLYSQYLSGAPGLGADLRDFLYGWWLSHIQGTDRHDLELCLRYQQKRAGTSGR